MTTRTERRSGPPRWSPTTSSCWEAAAKADRPTRDFRRSRCAALLVLVRPRPIPPRPRARASRMMTCRFKFTALLTLLAAYAANAQTPFPMRYLGEIGHLNEGET